MLVIRLWFLKCITEYDFKTVKLPQMRGVVLETPIICTEHRELIKRQQVICPVESHPVKGTVARGLKLWYPIHPISLVLSLFTVKKPSNYCSFTFCDIQTTQVPD